MIEGTTLVRDPVFQLNVFLWALEDLPDEAEGIYPVLRSAGYYLHAIGRRLLVPVEEVAVEALERVTGSRDRSPTHPDLWLKHVEDIVEPIIELKARGFSTESTPKVVQATKLIISSADLAPSAGGTQAQPGHVVYATVDEDAPALLKTLRSLQSDVEAAGAKAAPVGAIGLRHERGAVAFATPDPDALPPPLAQSLTTKAVVLVVASPQDSVQPLYFIPWVPGLDKSQDEQLRAQGLSELTARLLVEAISEIGRARVPTTISLEGARLLDRATFGVFQRWRDNDRGLFEKAAARLLERAFAKTHAPRLEGSRLDLDLPTSESQARAIERLEGADPMDPAKSIQPLIDEPTLFDIT